MAGTSPSGPPDSKPWIPGSHLSMIMFMTMTELATERLRLRHWRDADREPFAALNADPVVMEYYPAPLKPLTSVLSIRLKNVPRMQVHRSAVGSGYRRAHRDMA